MSVRKPLNGTKTHPLSAHALGVLRDMARQPIAGYRLNPGVRNRLWREGLAEEHEGVWTITDAGRAALAGGAA